MEQAKAKLDSVNASTATKHPVAFELKVLIAELCTVVRFLLEEIDRIKTPHLTQLMQFPEDKLPSAEPLTSPPPFPIVLPPRQRKGNAGDAE